MPYGCATPLFVSRYSRQPRAASVFFFAAASSATNARSQWCARARFYVQNVKADGAADEPGTLRRAASARRGTLMRVRRCRDARWRDVYAARRAMPKGSAAFC